MNPWRYDTNGTQALIVDEEGYTVAHIITLENSTAHKDLERNARLMAAAPELLAALDMIQEDKDGDGYLSAEGMEQVRLALARARGDWQ